MRKPLPFTSWAVKWKLKGTIDWVILDEWENEKDAKRSCQMYWKNTSLTQVLEFKVSRIKSKDAGWLITKGRIIRI